MSEWTRRRTSMTTNARVIVAIILASPFIIVGSILMVIGSMIAKYLGGLD